LFITLFSSTIKVSAQYPTDSAQVFLLTLSPGSEIYASFGHSAIRVSDHKHNRDFVYNYGTFDFTAPNFYSKFIFGRLLYSLSITDYRDFFMAYKMWGQAMWEQKLNLTNKEKWQFIQNLQTNYQEENRYYRYAFFRDNCSTRIRDIIEKSVDGKIVYDSTYIKQPESFRQLFSAYIEPRDAWALFGMDILMGKGTDSIAALKDYMFLPQNLMNLYSTAKISGDGNFRILASSSIELYPTTLSFEKPNPLTTPTTVFWALFSLVLILTYLGFKKKKYIKWFDVILFLISGLLGLLISILMIFSLHSELWSNLNVVWANPVNLIFAVGLFFRSKPRWFLYLMKAYGVLIIIFIPVSFLLTQIFPVAVYAIAGLLLIRTVKILYTSK